MQRESESGRIVISFKVKPDLKEALQTLAKQDHRTLSSYIELALTNHVAKARKAAKGKKGDG